jgi:hypothetical protein
MPALESPPNRGKGNHQNAGAYMQIGEAMGREMLDVLKNK